MILGGEYFQDHALTALLDFFASDADVQLRRWMTEEGFWLVMKLETTTLQTYKDIMKHCTIQSSSK
jgi:hypothetical protein